MTKYIPTEDIELVVNQTEASFDEAKAALKQTDGEPAAAISQIRDGEYQSRQNTADGVPNSTIPQSDIEIVANQAEVSHLEAKNALEKFGGDVAAAITDLNR